MARIAALLPDQADRESLLRSVPLHDVAWVDSWRELDRAVRSLPVGAAIADAHAEPRKDGVLRVYGFAQRFPLTPLLVWGHFDGRELYRLGKAGCSELILSQDADDAAFVAELVDDALGSGLTGALMQRLSGRLHADALALVRHAAEGVPAQIQVPALAADFGLSVSTLERRCERWGLPTPGRLLLWLRVLYGLRWLAEPGRSVESVASQLGYSSGAAFRRALNATVGRRASWFRSPQAFERGAGMFEAELRPAAPAAAEA